MNIEKQLEERVRFQFLNEYTTISDYRKQSKEEHLMTLGESVLCEFVSTSKLTNLVFRGKTSEFLSNEKLKNSKFIKDITVSSGDITKTKHYSSIVDLLNYAVSVNANLTKASEKNTLFDSYAKTVLECLNHFKVNASKFKNLISREATNKGNSRLVLDFYVSMVSLLYITADSLYASSMNATFNYNTKQPSVERVMFEYESSIGLDEQLSVITVVNDLFRNGKIFKALDPSLQESLEDSMERIALNEGVIDTVFGLVSHFKTLDLLVLWPIYITRAITYWLLYVFTSVKDVHNGIEHSIAVQRSRLGFTKDQYDGYKASGSNRAFRVGQSMAKASVTMSLQANEDKAALQQLQASDTAGVLI